MDSTVGRSTDDRRLLALAYLPRPSGQRLQHLDEDESPLCDKQADDDAKLLGVYSSDAAAQARIESARTLPGFSDEPDRYQITLYTLGKDEWTEGFSIGESGGCRMRRLSNEAARSRAIGDSDQRSATPLPSSARPLVSMDRISCR